MFGASSPWSPNIRVLAGLAPYTVSGPLSARGAPVALRPRPAEGLPPRRAGGGTATRRSDRPRPPAQDGAHPVRSQALADRLVVAFQPEIAEAGRPTPCRPYPRQCPRRHGRAASARRRPDRRPGRRRRRHSLETAARAYRGDARPLRRPRLAHARRGDAQRSRRCQARRPERHPAPRRPGTAPTSMAACASPSSTPASTRPSRPGRQGRRPARLHQLGLGVGRSGGARHPRGRHRGGGDQQRLRRGGRQLRRPPAQRQGARRYRAAAASRCSSAASRWAADNGAHVINMSLGSQDDYESAWWEDLFDVAAMSCATRSATPGAAAPWWWRRPATGNNTSRGPAACPNVLAVAKATVGDRSRPPISTYALGRRGCAGSSIWSRASGDVGPSAADRPVRLLERHVEAARQVAAWPPGAGGLRLPHRRSSSTA